MAADCDDTPADLTGEKLEKTLLSEGEDPKFAKEMGEAYDQMLKEEKEGNLIEIK